MNKEAYAYALKLLSRKDYFEAEIRASLERRYPDEDHSPVIARLLEDKYIDDERSLRSFVRWKTSEGYGPYYVREKLRNKQVNVPLDAIYGIIEQEELDLESIMIDVVRKYLRTKGKKKDTAAFMRSALNYMAYRGFPAGESLNILKSEVPKNESDFFEGC